MVKKSEFDSLNRKVRKMGAEFSEKIESLKDLELRRVRDEAIDQVRRDIVGLLEVKDTVVEIVGVQYRSAGDASDLNCEYVVKYSINGNEVTETIGIDHEKVRSEGEDVSLALAKEIASTLTADLYAQIFDQLNPEKGGGDA